MTRIVITTDGDDVSVEIHDGETSGQGDVEPGAPGAEPGPEPAGPAGDGREADRFDRASATNAGGPPPELLEAAEPAGGEETESGSGSGSGGGDWPPTEERPDAGIYAGGQFEHRGVDRERE
jgi:hypothetical protein